MCCRCSSHNKRLRQGGLGNFGCNSGRADRTLWVAGLVHVCSLVHMVKGVTRPMVYVAVEVRSWRVGRNFSVILEWFGKRLDYSLGSVLGCYHQRLCKGDERETLGVEVVVAGVPNLSRGMVDRRDGPAMQVGPPGSCASGQDTSANIEDDKIAKAQQKTREETSDIHVRRQHLEKGATRGSSRGLGHGNQH